MAAAPFSVLQPFVLFLLFLSVNVVDSDLAIRAMEVKAATLEGPALGLVYGVPDSLCAGEVYVCQLLAISENTRLKHVETCREMYCGQ